jgi:hypothetical protein
VAEALEDHGHLEQAPGPHLVGVLLEAPFPVRVLVDAGVGEEVEDLPDLGRRDHRPKAYAISVLLRDPHAGVVREDPELVKADLAGWGRV